MKKNLKILLPGAGEQIEYLKKNLTSSPKSILVIGASSEVAAIELSNAFDTNVQLIVEDYESLLNSKLLLEGNSRIQSKMMSFESTDFTVNEFDLIYAQASISLVNRNKIVKEIKRILKPGGYLCVGEVTKLTNDIPTFMKNIFESSGQLPLLSNDLDKYYSERNWKMLGKKNLTHTLKDFYNLSYSQMKTAIDNLADSEKSYYKIILNRISHESNIYLNFGGNKYIGFYSMILQKGEN